MLSASAALLFDQINIPQFSKDEKVTKKEVPKPEELPDLLSVPSPRTFPVEHIITIETKNTVTLRGPVTRETVDKLIKTLTKISRDVPKDSTIYLVLDTPGGSVSDGADLIDFLNALPQKVTTITLFAASMGFQIVENNPGDRFIVWSGILMSHRAAISGLSGQFDGELESRYRMMKRQVDVLEAAAAARMGLSIFEYKAEVNPELWIHGFDAVEQKAADQEVLVKCGESYDDKTIDTVFQTMFGPVTVVFDACPLIKQPIEIKMSGISEGSREYVSSVIYELLLYKERFVKEWILTDKFNTFFP